MPIAGLQEITISRSVQSLTDDDAIVHETVADLRSRLDIPVDGTWPADVARW